MKSKRIVKKHMKKQHLLLERLIKYNQSDEYPFHMPGHKRQSEFPNPFAIDITEIEGFDNLHRPVGILQESMAWAASVYGADRTYYLVNGSSGGILSAICAVVSFGGTLLMSRNCHKAVYHGVIPNHLKTEYVYPQFIPEMGIQGGILAVDVDKMLNEHPDVEAVVIVSPTYDGVVSDIQAIAGVVHKRGIPLLVDEAHGAHFPFMPGVKSALDCGADLVIQSLHKTLPSLTQTAVLHVMQGYLSIERLERYLQMFQSSSPSYVFMSSIEKCIFDMQSQEGKKQMADFVAALAVVRRQLAGLRMLRLLNPGVCGKYGVFDLDEAKIVVSARGCGRTMADGSVVRVDGSYMSDWLRRDYHLEMEMSGADYVVAITSFMDTKEGLGRLVSAFLEMDRQLVPVPVIGYEKPPAMAESRMILADAMDGRTESLLMEQCANRISAEFIYLYPPGIPLAAPGELISEAMIGQLAEYRKMGLPIQGMEDITARYLKVIK